MPLDVFTIGGFSCGAERLKLGEIKHPLEEFTEERLREHLADMDWVEAMARAHERVLQSIRAQTTVVPMTGTNDANAVSAPRKTALGTPTTA